MNMGKVLLVGGGGFVGAHLAAVLHARGYGVVALGRRAAPAHALPEAVRYLSGDYADLATLRSALDGCTGVVHLAYASVPNTSFDNPLSDLLGNLPPSLQLFQELAKRRLRLVFVSSGGTVYGQAHSLPVREDHSTFPVSPYGVTKLTLEKYVHLLFHTSALDVVCVRPGNAYGPGQFPYAGQGFVSTAIASALDGRPVRLFGKTGTIRDYVHVYDMAEGIAAALDGGKTGRVYNLGTGVGLSNLDILEKLRPLMAEVGARLVVEEAPERVFDVAANVLDATRLRDDTGWAPRIGIDEGLRLTRDWLLQHAY